MRHTVDIYDGIERLLNAALPKLTPIELGITIREMDSGDEWSYDLAFSHGPGSDSGPVVTSEAITHNNDAVPQHHYAADRSATRLEDVRAGESFEPIKRALWSIRNPETDDRIPPAMLHSKASLRRMPPYGELLVQVARLDESERERRLRQVHLMLTHLVDDVAVSVVPGASQGLRFEMSMPHWRDDAPRLCNEEISDGTLRLFSLLWHITSDVGVVLIDDIEAHLKPLAVSLLGDTIHHHIGLGGPQFIVTTHLEDLAQEENWQPNSHVTLEQLGAGSGTNARAAQVGIDER